MLPSVDDTAKETARRVADGGGLDGLARLTASFGAAAGQYQRGRPEYPKSAVEWLVPRGAKAVLDLAAGTGKLTRSLVEAGLKVTAVEPSAGMREQLVAAV